MGGKSTTEQTSTQQSQQQAQQAQNSTTAPWLQAQPALQGILGQLGINLGNTGVTGAENNALNNITANANNSTQYVPQISNLIGNLLGGGGADAQSGNISSTLEDYKRRLNPTADGTQIGQNSGLLPYLDTIRNDVTNQVNGSFAAAGRDFSGSNQQALARGIAQGQAPVIAGQYNTDVANMRGAADALYGAGNTTAGLLTGLNQQGLANQQAGAGMVPGLNELQNSGSKAILEAEAARRGIPVQALGLLANIGIPIAGLGAQSEGTATSKGSSSGTGTQRGESQMSGADQFLKIASGASSLVSPIKWLLG